jgi:L-ascorbate metabolism protein UlaG (beta-lactamase superfamily)
LNPPCGAGDLSFNTLELHRDLYHDDVRLLRPEIVIAEHYNAFPLIEQDATLWAAQAKAQTLAQPVVLQPGKTLIMAE